MRVKTAELNGKALDWVVGKAAGINVGVNMERCVTLIESYAPIKMKPWEPSTDWSQCGPLIEQFNIGVGHVEGEDGWWSSADYENGIQGETPQISICRAVVASKLGDEVDIPDEMMEV